MHNYFWDQVEEAMNVTCYSFAIYTNMKMTLLSRVRNKNGVTSIFRGQKAVGQVPAHGTGCLQIQVYQITELIPIVFVILITNSSKVHYCNKNQHEGRW